MKGKKVGYARLGGGGGGGGGDGDTHMESKTNHITQLASECGKIA